MEPASPEPSRTAERPPLDWINLLFIAGAHLMAVLAVVYLLAIRCSGWTLGLGLVWGLLCGVAVTGGYHRLFSHAAYVASPILRAIYLAFGAAAVQNSVLAWASDHRMHHAHTDSDADPYDIRRGFWWAHIGWVLHKRPANETRVAVRDLEADPLVRMQQRFYLPIAIFFGAVVPTLIGLAWGDPIGAFLVAGWLRLVLLWHATFSINSFTHSFGRQTYSRQISARDSLWVALITLGEGYHNFHHRFQADYRNGVRWYHFDPTKWWIWTMARLGLAGRLRRVPADRIAAARHAPIDTATSA